MVNESHLRIAIIGGGLAGATLANALLRHPHLDIHVYESAPQFSERGAAVGLAVNSLKALDHIFPEGGAALLKRGGGVALSSTRVMIGMGPAAGSLVFDLAGTDPGIVVHRASILRELLAPLPESLLHANKKLSCIEETSGGVKLAFEDGTTEVFDSVIGADGIFSTVRQHILRGSGEEFAASAAGWWDCRVLVPFGKAKATLGAELFELDRQYCWVGSGAMLMHDLLDEGRTVQCVICIVEKDPPKDRKRPLTREAMEKKLEGWPSGSVAKGMIDLMLDQPDPHGYSEWEHKSTPTYSRGRVCVMGDAAHASSPWQGSGAGMAIEDAVILGHLLGHIKSAREIELAFKAYSDVRLPRCQHIIDSSRGTGELLCGIRQDIGLDPHKLGEALAPRWNFISSLDIVAHEQEALDKFKENIEKEGVS